MSVLSPQAQKILQKAYSLRNEGKIEASFKQVRSVSKKHGDNLHVIYLLGTLFLEKRDYKKAVLQFEKGIKLDPKGHVNQAGLGTAYYRLKDYSKAIEWLIIAHQRAPKEFSHERNLAFAYYDALQFDKAKIHLEKLFKQKQDDIEIASYLGMIYRYSEEYTKAKMVYTICADKNPKNIRAIENLASLLIERTLTKEATFVNNKILELDPDNLTAYFRGYTIASQEGNKDNIAFNLKEIAKRLDKANIETKIDFLSAVLKSKTRDETLLEVSEKLYPDIKHFAENKKKLAQIKYDSQFNLSHIFETKEEYDLSFSALQHGNNRKKEYNKLYGREFNRAHFDAYVKNLNEFTNWAEIYKNASVEDDRMIFICALPRSGTTLMEQIFAAHPDCEGIGESMNLDYLKFNVAKQNVKFPPQIDWPQTFEKLTLEERQQLAQYYINGVNKDLSEQPDANLNCKRVVEKSIGNFLHVGLLAALFPKAKFIYCRRNRAASGLSIYQQNFVNQFLFDNDLDDINFMFDQLENLMTLWDEQLPGRILTVNYEDLVTDPEIWGKKLISHVDLEWDPRCLDFYKNKRVIKTASLHQARSKIYATSADRYQNYAKFLTPLLQK